MAKLTRFQRELLGRLTTIDGPASTSYISRFSNDVGRYYKNLRAMEARGLVARDQRGYWPLWRITAAGRAALAEHQP